MKQIIPFKKEIVFKTMISKVTSISLEHTLDLEDGNNITGDFIISGTYKMTEASQLDEDFSYKIPIEITIDSKYDTSNVTLDIDDFTYSVEDEEKLVLNIDLCIDGLELKENPEETKESVLTDESSDDDRIQNVEEITSDLFLDTSKDTNLEVPAITNSNTNNNTDNNSSTPSIFCAFSNTDETFATYSVYIVREGDSLDTIINKYKTNKEELELYNDLSDIRIGSKIIIPTNND